MSRVDEALRRAALDGPTLHGPAPVEPAAVSVDESALSGFLGERAHVDAPRPSDRGPQTRTIVREDPVNPAELRPSRPAPAERAPRYHTSLEGKSVVSRETNAASVEQYRRLAATLLSMQAERGLKTLIVSSGMPGEGKTLTITNLALTLSEAYARRVLLVDADFRRPSVHEMFGIMNTSGLAESLQSANRSPSMITISSTLSVVPTGHPGANPIAALSSDRMRAFVAGAAERFDWVLIDPRPIGLPFDANLLTGATDGVLFVVAAGITPYTVVQRSIAEIGADR